MWPGGNFGIGQNFGWLVQNIGRSKGFSFVAVRGPLDTPSHQ